MDSVESNIHSVMVEEVERLLARVESGECKALALISVDDDGLPITAMHAIDGDKIYDLIAGMEALKYRILSSARPA